MDKHLTKLYLIIFSIGMFLEPLWGLYMNMSQSSLVDPLSLRIMLGVFCLVMVGVLKLKPNHFDKYGAWWIRAITLAFTVHRYYLVHLNAVDLNTVIDLYTIVILGSVITHSKKDLWFHAAYVLLPSVMFPQKDYVVLMNLVTILPLIGALKYTYFQHLQMLKDTQEKVKENSFEDGILRIMNATSHEVNNRLSKINLQTELLKYNFEDKEDLKRLALVEQEVKGIANVYKFYAQIENAKEPELQYHNLSSLVGNTLTRFQNKIYNNDISVTIDNSYKSEIRTCENIFDIILGTIVNNALYELSKIATKRKLTINIGTSLNSYFIDVIDSAGTLKAEDTKRCFEPFYTTKDINEGRGMGLALAKKMGEKIGIKLRAYKKEEGTVFRILIS